MKKQRDDFFVRIARVHNIYRSGVLQKAEIRAVVINQTNKWGKGANNIPPEIVDGGIVAENIPGKQFNEITTLSEYSSDTLC